MIHVYCRSCSYSIGLNLNLERNNRSSAQYIFSIYEYCVEIKKKNIIKLNSFPKKS